MTELRRRIEAGRQGRDRLDAARDWARDHGGTLDAADLAELANGPVLDPLRTALPLGRCSEEEYRRRNRCAP
ncbi:hypothetical protein vBEliSR6L_30 [Erythrobacter phage vB_EliS_R6L]|nr:hypothetical protein vBEliSR6L_30 [Erythrobacter phage vB_EliS_R6L]